MKLDKHTMMQIENLKDLYDFDFDNQVVTIPLHFTTAEDLIDEHLSHRDKPVVSKPALDYLIDVITGIPSIFTVDFTLTVDDCGEYTHEQLLKAIRNTIENRFYYYDSGRKKDNVLAVLFVIVGIIFMALNVMGVHNAWFGQAEAVSTKIIESLLDVISWVFIWEGGAILFLTYENDSTFFHKEIRRLKSIRMLDATGKQLIDFDSNELYEDWAHIGKGEIFARNFMLFAYPVIIAGTCVEMSEFIGLIPTMTPVELGSYIFSWIMIVLMTVSNISLYLDRGRIKHLALPLSLIMTAYMIFSLVVWVTTPEINVKFFIFDCIITAFLVINTVCLLYMRKQSVNIDKRRKK